MKLRTPAKNFSPTELLNEGYCTSYVTFFNYHNEIDLCSSKIINSLIKDSFQDSLSGEDPDLDGWLCLASYSSLARVTGYNPVTVQKRIDAMIKKGIMEVVDVYPKTGRQLVSVYRVFYNRKSSV